MFKNQQFSNDKVQSTFENGQVIWTNTLNWTRGYKFFNMCQNLVTCHLCLSFYLIFFYHINTHLWMIMMEFKIVMV